MQLLSSQQEYDNDFDNNNNDDIAAESSEVGYTGPVTRGQVTWAPSHGSSDFHLDISAVAVAMAEEEDEEGKEYNNRDPNPNTILNPQEEQQQQQQVYGLQHIDPIAHDQQRHPLFVDLVLNCRELLTKKKLAAGAEALVQNSSDPGVRVAFSSRLDSTTQRVQDMQVRFNYNPTVCLSAFLPLY